MAKATHVVKHQRLYTGVKGQTGLQHVKAGSQLSLKKDHKLGTKVAEIGDAKVIEQPEPAEDSGGEG